MKNWLQKNNKKCRQLPVRRTLYSVLLLPAEAVSFAPAAPSLSGCQVPTVRFSVPFPSGLLLVASLVGSAGRRLRLGATTAAITAPNRIHTGTAGHPTPPAGQSVACVLQVGGMQQMQPPGSALPFALQ